MFYFVLLIGAVFLIVLCIDIRNRIDRNDYTDIRSRIDRINRGSAPKDVIPSQLEDLPVHRWTIKDTLLTILGVIVSYPFYASAGEMAEDPEISPEWRRRWGVAHQIKLGLAVLLFFALVLLIVLHFYWPVIYNIWLYSG